MVNKLFVSAEHPLSTLSLFIYRTCHKTLSHVETKFGSTMRALTLFVI